MMNNNVPIDVVITWVDGSDPMWIKQRNNVCKELGLPLLDVNNVRYRDWDNLQYIFRGIDQYMPWIRKVHFVTWGHIPKWLNVEDPRINIVKHDEFIPDKYLPTYNSSTIELNLFRIKGLSEQFINFNDDMFVINKTNPEEFFKNGMPCDMACISPQPIKIGEIFNTEFNNLQIINKYFTTDDVKRNIKKWNKPLLYGQYAIRTLIFMHFKTIIGLFEQHIPFSYKKSTIQKVWTLEEDALDRSCMHKFRSCEDHNEWLFRAWQLLSGDFIPRSKDFGILVPASDTNQIENVLRSKKYKFICINDDENIKKFVETKQHINNMLKSKFPNKSSFER